MVRKLEASSTTSVCVRSQCESQGKTSGSESGDPESNLSSLTVNVMTLNKSPSTSIQ